MIERESHKTYQVLLLEKLIINFALPSDFIYHSFRAIFQRDRSQTVTERLMGLWDGKVEKYQKLLRVKDENNGRIPEDYRQLCGQTPCGKVRFWLAERRDLDKARMKTVEAGEPRSHEEVKGHEGGVQDGEVAEPLRRSA